MANWRLTWLGPTMSAVALSWPLVVVAQQQPPRGLMMENELGPNAGRTPAILGPRATGTPPTPRQATGTPGDGRTPPMPSSSTTPRLDEQPRSPKNPGQSPSTRVAGPAPQTVPQDIIDRVMRLVEQRNFQAALNLVDSAIRDRGESAPLAVLRGRIFCSFNQFDDCLRGINRGLELDPQSADAYLFRARVFGFNAPKTEANRQSALRDFAEAKRLAPNSAAPHFFHGLYVLEIGKELQPAIELFDQAIALEPGHHRAHARKTTALFEYGQPDRALAAADVAIRQVPNAPEPLAIRALVMLGRGDREAAQRDLRTAASLSRTFEVYTSLGLSALAASQAFGTNGSIVSSGAR